MFTINVTFVAEPAKERELTEYLRETVVPRLFNDSSEARNPVVRKVVEIGGHEPEPGHAMSIALSADFDSKEAAHSWENDFLMPLMKDFHLKFGNDALFFITLLENIPH